LDLTGRKWREAAEDCIMRSFINLYVPPNIIRIIKSRSMRWARHVVCMGEMKNAYSILVKKSGGKYHSEDLCVDGKILEWVFGK
jgi:hypothetical protein